MAFFAHYLLHICTLASLPSLTQLWSSHLHIYTCRSATLEKLEIAERRSGVLCLTLTTGCQACSLLPSLTSSPPFDRYQAILLGDRGTQATAQVVPRRHSKLRPTNCKSDAIPVVPARYPVFLCCSGWRRSGSLTSAMWNTALTEVCVQFVSTWVK